MIIVVVKTEFDALRRYQAADQLAVPQSVQPDPGTASSSVARPEQGGQGLPGEPRVRAEYGHHLPQNAQLRSVHR